MEINTSSIIDQQQTATMQQIQVSLFKKAIDMNAQAALTLIGAALPQTQTSSTTVNNPPNLGQNIDVSA